VIARRPHRDSRAPAGQPPPPVTESYVTASGTVGPGPRVRAAARLSRRPGRRPVRGRTREPEARAAVALLSTFTDIWILSSVGTSISNETFDIEDFDIECSFDIDVFYIRYRISISKVFDIEGNLIRYRRGHTIDIKCY
jgi:hypothetical protein